MPRAQRRIQLLDTARAIACRDGMDALTMSALAEEAGVSKPVVYEHFRSSEDVGLALLDACFEKMISDIDSRSRAAETLRDYLSIVVDYHFEMEKSGDLSPRMITNGGSRSHAVGERLNARFQEIRQLSVRTLQELLQQQGAAEGVAWIAGQVIFDVLNSAPLPVSQNEDKDLARATMKTIIDAVIGAIVPASLSRPHTPQAILDNASRLREALRPSS